MPEKKIKYSFSCNWKTFIMVKTSRYYLADHCCMYSKCCLGRLTFFHKAHWVSKIKLHICKGITLIPGTCDTPPTMCLGALNQRETSAEIKTLNIPCGI